MNTEKIDARRIAGEEVIFTWPLRDGREVERRNPRLTCAEQLPFTANHHIIPVRGDRVLYRLMNAVPIVRNMFRWYPFTL
ncbi:MAG TPA: hypothetical protein VFV66_30885 [Nonomuraea sp.]|nr:hypothetical protein [Nonomuraea sp.]